MSYSWSYVNHKNMEQAADSQILAPKFAEPKKKSIVPQKYYNLLVGLKFAPKFAEQKKK